MDRLDRDRENAEPSMHTRRVFLAGAGLAGVGLAASAAGASAGSRGRSWAPGYLAWVEVRPGVFATTNLESGGNCLAVGGRDGALLVDTKFPVFARQLRRDVELTVGPISRVVNTHHHADHTGGNLEFTGSASVIAHENAAGRVARQLESYLGSIDGSARQLAGVPESEQGAIADDMRVNAGRRDRLTAQDFTPTVLIGDGRSGLDMGGTWVELHSFGRGAHTDNDVIVRIPEQNVVHTGDLVFNRVYPYFDANGGANSLGWIETLHEVAALCDDETVVVPGHGRITDGEGILAMARYIERLREAVGKELDAGTPKTEVQEKTWPFMDGYQVDWIRSIGIGFVYDELTHERAGG